MKKDCLILIFLISLILVSCEKGVTSLNYSAENKSSVEVEVSATKYRTQPIVLKSGGYFESVMYPGRGKASFNGKPFGFILEDTKQISVTFNKTIHVVHYNDSLPHTGTYLNKISNRCLYSPESYTVKIIDKKGEYTETAQYVFTEQDYIDAQKP